MWTLNKNDTAEQPSRLIAPQGETHDVRTLGEAPVSQVVSQNQLLVSWIVLTVLAGSGAAALSVWNSGLACAVPAAFGLTALAGTDLTNRRLPAWTMLSTFGSMLSAGTWDASRTSEWMKFVEAWAIAGAVAVVALLLWALTSGIAFGDVKLLGIAAFVPAMIAPHTVIRMVFFALVASLVVVGIRWLRRGDTSRPTTIAFAPPLLLGWLVSVMAS